MSQVDGERRPCRDAPPACGIERVGIIGAGAAAALHLHALRRIEDLQVVGIRDLDPRRAAALAGRFGLPAEVADPDRFYGGRPQSIHIVTTPGTHQTLALEALQHGAHVLVEKPPALTVPECRILLEEAARQGLAIGVNENTALDPLIRRGRAMIEAGLLGRLLHIEVFYAAGLRDGDTAPPWMNRLPGGMLEDLLPHLLTTARALAGVQLLPEHWRLLTTGRIQGERHDELRILLTGGDGLTANLALSLSARPRAFSLTARGTRAMLAIDLRRMLLCASRPEARGGAVAVGAELVRSSLGALWQTAFNAAGLVTGYREPHGSFFHLIGAHYAALRERAELPAPLARAAETVALARTIWPASEASVSPPEAAHFPEGTRRAEGERAVLLADR